MRTLVIDTSSSRAVLRVDAEERVPSGSVRLDVLAVTLHATRLGADARWEPGGEVVGRVIEVAGDAFGRRPGERVVTVVRRGAASDRIVVPAATLEPVPDDMSDEVAVLAAGSGLRASLVFAEVARAGAASVVVTSPGRPAALLLAGLARRRGMVVVAAATTGDALRSVAAAGYDHGFALDDVSPAVVRTLESLPGPSVLVEFGARVVVPPGLGPALRVRIPDMAETGWNLEPAGDSDDVIVNPAALAARDFAAIRRHFTEIAAAIASNIAATPVRTFTFEEAVGSFPAVVRPPVGAVVLVPSRATATVPPA